MQRGCRRFEPGQLHHFTERVDRKTGRARDGNDEVSPQRSLVDAVEGDGGGRYGPRVFDN